MERKVRKCPVCGEWFNTTDEIMVKHYWLYHAGPFAEFSRAAALTATRLQLALSQFSAALAEARRAAAAARLKEVR